MRFEQRIRAAEQRELGHWILGIATIFYGVACFLQRDFAIFWQPVPESLPLRQPLAFLSAGLLVLSGAGLLFRRTMRAAAMIQILLFLAYVAAFLANIAEQPGTIWLGVCENLAVAVGAATIWMRTSAHAPARSRLVAVRIVYGVCSVVFGLAHFIAIDGTAGMVPEWLPGSGRFWAGFTGLCHLAVAAALFANRLAIPATRLAGLMYLGFAALCWLPGAITHPDQWLRWAGLGISLAMMGAVWLVGDLLRARDVAAEPAASVGEGSLGGALGPEIA
ncbi:hypothetical protein [Sphingosinicella sp. BN140058]|uniref:hypothetical protein n=1 Tax=Sphingosinicella sp. BN140058 TaxID=1892855 RepID=UPI0010122B94|nr:hypothetical protein [Sphingosinicella sp. BN140058]QAY78382.1 hypothetical protein ETR14_18960 [Sphingosinicella sp. BN140058]